MSGGAYRLSRQAERDIVEIEEFTAQKWGDSQAEAYVNKLFDAVRKLADNPRLGRVRSDIPPPYLVYSVNSHLIVYRHNPEAGRVEVLNVLHPAMDIEKRVLEALKRKGA